MTESKFEAVLTQAFHEYVDEKLENNSCNIEEFKTSERFEKSIKRMIKNWIWFYRLDVEVFSIGAEL